MGTPRSSSMMSSAMSVGKGGMRSCKGKNAERMIQSRVLEKAKVLRQATTNSASSVEDPIRAIEGMVLPLIT
jgi:hypothetical protein